MHDQKQIYSLRKLSVGLASVIVGTCFFISTNRQNVQADTLNVSERQVSTVIQQDSSKKQEQDSNEQNDQTNVNNSKTEQQQSTNERNDVENVDSNLNDTNKLDNTTKRVESEANQRFDQVKDQFKQETPIKQAPVNEQPAVPNKDTNINLNSNLNKNTIKQALADSLLKDITKPETTNTLNMTKASQTPIAENMLKEDKIEVKENQDWADPAKQGFHKTTAGWTKLQQGKDYNAVAKKSVLTFYDNGHVISDGQTLHETINKSFENDADISVVIDKDDLKEGNRILIGSAAFLYPDDRRINYESRGGSSYQLADSRTNTTIGNISVSLNNNDPDELDYFLDVKSPDKYAKDLSFTISHAAGRGFAKNDVVWMNYSRLSGTTTDNPFRTKVLTPQNTTYNIEIEPDSNFNMKYSKIVPTTGSNIVQGVTAGWNSQFISLYDANGSYTIAPDDQSDHVFKRVFQLKNLTNQSLIPSDIIINPHIAPINLDSDVGNMLKLTELPRIKAERKADNLTNTQLLEQTARGHYTWSQQSDGSILICYNLHSNDMTISTPLIDDMLKNTNWWHIENPTNKQQILNHTEDVYKERGNKLIRFAINSRIIVNNYSNKPYDVLVNNLTPTDANDQSVKLYISNLKYVPVGTTLGLDLEAIRNINVKFVDDDQTNPVKDTTLIKTTTTGKDLTFTLSSDSSSDNVIKIPDNVILSDSQPDLTKFNYDPTTKTFHYGVVKDTNPDVTIHVKHKILKGISGDDKILDDYPGIKKALNREIKFVANYTYPDNGKFTDEKAYPKQKVFSLILKRSADADLTTDSIVSGTAGAWSAVNQNGITFNNGLVSSGSNFGETLPEGYTLQNGSDTTTNAFNTDAFQTSARNAFASLRNAGGSVTKVFNYVIKADPQKIQVKFVDDDDPNEAQVGDIITVNGVTDGQADFEDVISAYKQDQAKHYDLTGYTDPNKLTHIFSANDSTAYTIHLKHHINDVKAENAEDATRTIVIKKFNGNGNLTSTQTVVQRIAFYKHDYVDAVTGKTKSSKYIFDDKSSPALSHNLVDGKATNDPSYTLKDGKYYFAKYKLDVPAGYKAKKHVDKINPNLLTISLFALPAISTATGNKTVDPNANKGQSDTNKKQDASSSSVTDKANNSNDLHDNSKKQNDQPIILNNKTDHTINVSAQAVDPTVEPERNNVASSNNSTTSAQTQQSSTNDAEQVKNTSIDVPSREENNANKGSNSSYNRSKPNSGKISHVNSKTPQNGLNEPSKAQSVATHPATTSVINNSKSDAKQLPQTGEKDNYTYSALGLLLGLNVAMTAVYAEKKRKKY